MKAHKKKSQFAALALTAGPANRLTKPAFFAILGKTKGSL